MRRVALVVVVLGGLFLATADQATADDQACRTTGFSSVCSGGSSGSRPSNPGGGNGERVWYLEVAAIVDGPGGRCWTTVSVAYDRPPTQAERQAARESLDAPGLFQFAACPPAEPQISPEDWVRSYLSEHGPASPVPRVTAGRAITGLPTYLVTDIDETWSDSVADTPFGPLALTGTAVITVDWGDGTTSSHAVAGEDYPDGEITHVYIDSARRDLVVTYRWSVEWAFGASSGTLAVARSGGLDDFAVGEVQAVVRTP